MKSSLQELPVALDVPIGVQRQVTWDRMNVGVVKIHQSFDGAPLFAGLPDDRCQVHHWGYILKGRLRCKFADHEEVYNEGDVFYIPPGHTPFYEAGLQYIIFSPCDEAEKQQEITAKNLQAALK